VIVFINDTRAFALGYVLYKYQQQKICCSANREDRKRVGEKTEAVRGKVTRQKISI